MADLERKSVLILGIAREGMSTYRFLRGLLPEKTMGLADRLSWEDLDQATRETLAADGRTELHLGPGYLGSLWRYELVFKAPGISPLVPEVAEAERRGTQFSSNTELFFQHATGPIVGVTGTKGKSTTTSVIHRVLKAGGIDARLTGNIGTAPLSSLVGAAAGTVLVAELSSHQLSGIRASPHVAVVQNVVPEHLDYYGSFEAYVRAKENIVRWQGPGDFVVYNGAYPLPTAMARLSPAMRIPFVAVGPGESGCVAKGDYLIYQSGDRQERIVASEDVPLKGGFNLQNVMPAICVGRLFGVPTEAMAEAIRSFPPLAHRLEPVGEWNGVAFYNDSLATTPEAATAAIESFAGKSLVLIAGGADRGLEFSTLSRAVMRARVRGLVLFPTTGEKIWEAVAREGAGRADLPASISVTSMPEAVAEACRLAREGDVVLMSPASASFGLFKDYQDRGDQFRAEVARLVASSRQVQL